MKFTLLWAGTKPIFPPICCCMKFTLPRLPVLGAAPTKLPGSGVDALLKLADAGKLPLLKLPCCCKGTPTYEAPSWRGERLRAPLPDNFVGNVADSFGDGGD